MKVKVGKHNSILVMFEDFKLPIGHLSYLFLVEVIKSQMHSLRDPGNRGSTDMEGFFFFFKILFIFRERGREGERERNINVWLPLECPLLSTWPATQACALTGN